MTIPNSMISVNILFIVDLTFTTSAKRASRMLSAVEKGVGLVVNRREVLQTV